MTEALTASLLPTEELPGAVATDANAMIPHIAHLHKMIDIATSRPDDFYYAVVVVGKDGCDPAIHGTISGALLTLTGDLFTNPEDKMMIGALLASGISAAEVFVELATIDRPEFQPSLDNYTDDEDYVTIGGDVAGVQPSALLGDLNGDGVVDEKDEVLRLATLADDGNPHSGE